MKNVMNNVLYICMFSYFCFDVFFIFANCSFKFIVFHFRLTLAFTYYGISFYSTELDGNKFLNFFYLGLAEIPATLYCLFTANRYGRKKSLFVSLMIGGLLCLAFIIIPTGDYLLNL